MASNSIQERLVAGAKGYRKSEIPRYTLKIYCSMQFFSGVGGSQVETR